MDIKKRLGKRIQELRMKNALKQAELAEKVGIATKHQSCIETGKNFPSADLIERYAEIFKIDTADLLLIQNDKSKPKLIEEINNLLNIASENEVKKVHKVVKDILL